MILHVDMDAFYASIEQRDDPRLQGRPVVVGGSANGRGVVCAASYEARKFGIHSAMPAARARRLCPRAVFIPPRMEHYANVSSEIRDIFHQFTPLVEPLSLDEAFLDVTGSETLFGSSVEIGRRVQETIHKETKLAASVGVAPNKFLAKIASDLEKPQGFVVVDPNNIHGFLHPLPISRLWGVGRVTEQAFQRLGVRTIGDLSRYPLKALQEQFGQHGEHLHQLALGIDLRHVEPARKAKSVSHETTFPHDIQDPEILRAWTIELADQVSWRLRQQQIEGRTIQVKMRFANFDTITRSQQTVTPTNVTSEIQRIGLEILSRIELKQPVRLLGLGVSSFDDSSQRQKSLFDEEDRGNQQRVDAAADQIRKKYGHQSLTRGSNILHQAQHRPSPRPPENES